MKFQLPKNSLFAVLLRSPWWISIAIAAVLGLVAAALLPAPYRVLGALSSMPFIVSGAIAARRQWRMPSAAQVAQTTQDLGKMAWPEFAGQLEQAFRRDGYAVQRGTVAPVDFELERKGRRTVVSARRWKSARAGLEVLRALQDAREAADAQDALYIGLGDLTDNARPFATKHRITVWQAAELVQALLHRR